ncbi:MAG TPA: chemotaxis protein CheW [Nitrospirota bacterium]|nr:chemotaxis protein CheW [Nitrospirota bacterium]
MKSSYLLFLLAERLFGVKLVGAIEILPWRPSRRVPLSYSYVEGLLDYLGTVYPVHNLAQRLGVGKPGPIGFAAGQNESTSKGQSIILLEENSVPFGIVVDSVMRMMSLEEPVTAPEKVRGVDPKYVRGFSHEENQEIMILDFERLLHAD